MPFHLSPWEPPWIAHSQCSCTTPPPVFHHPCTTTCVPQYSTTSAPPPVQCSVHPSAPPPVQCSVHPSAPPPVQCSVHPSAPPPVQCSVHPSAPPPVQCSVHPSAPPPVQCSVHPSAPPPVHPTVLHLLDLRMYTTVGSSKMGRYCIDDTEIKPLDCTMRELQDGVHSVSITHKYWDRTILPRHVSLEWKELWDF